MPPNLTRYEQLAREILASLHYEVVITSSRFGGENEDHYRFVLFEGVYACDWKRGVFGVWGIITPDANLLLTTPQDEHGRAIPRRDFRARGVLTPGDASTRPSSKGTPRERRAGGGMGSHGVQPGHSAPREVCLDGSATLCDRHGRALPRANSRNQLPI